MLRQKSYKPISASKLLFLNFKMYYSTKFVWYQKQMYVYYNYKSLGYVPTDVQFTYRNKEYGTIPIMNALSKIHTLKLNAKLDHQYWFGSGMLNRKRIIELQKLLGF